MNVPNIVNNATSGEPIGLDVLTTSGAVLTPGSACAAQASGYSLATPKGITIGGNSIDGLGATGLNANAGELGSIALGNLASTDATATNSIALGTGSTVTAGATGAIALGNGATATTAGGVSLGAGSIDRAAVPTGGVTLNGTAYAFAGATPASVASVGSPGAERQIVNVAAGQLDAASTDAVNGSQLFATNTAVGSLNTTVAALGADSVLYDDAGHTSVTLSGPVSADGGATNGTRVTNLSQGALNATSSDAVNGAQLFATNNTVNLLSSGGLGPVQYSNPATPTTPNGGTPTQNLTLVGVAAGPVTLHDVAPGSLAAGSTDAVNGGQVNGLGSSLATNLGGGATFDPTSGQVTAPAYTINGATYNNVGAALSALTGGGAGGAGIKYFHANSTGPDSKAIGADSVAIGTGATANNTGDVALGAGSTTAGANPNAGAVINGTAYTFAGATPTSVVSVGAPGAERQITNLAAGQLNAGSTDAVNGSQLFATNTALGALGTTVSGLAANAVQYDNAGHTSVTLSGPVSVDGGLTGGTRVSNLSQGTLNPTSTDAVNGAQLYATNQSIANILNGSAGAFASNNAEGAPNPVASGANSSAGGFGASATGANSLALGNGANDGGNAGATALGNGAAVTPGLVGTNTALGQGASVTAAATSTPTGVINGLTYTFAGGAPTGVVSVGGVGTEHQVQNVAAGQLNAASTDAVNGSQLFATNSAIGTITTALGGLGSPGGTGSTAIGAGSSTASGATNGVALGNGASTTVAGGVALGSGSAATTGPGAPAYVPVVANPVDSAAVSATNSTAGAVAVGNPSGGVLRQITGVAGGTANTDAANVAQVRAVADAVQAGAIGPVQYSNPAAPTLPNGGVPSNDLTLLGATPSSPVALHNVAPGTASTDAATVGQVNAGMTAAINQSEAYTNQVAGVLLNNIRAVAREAYAGTASAIAMENAPYVAGKWTYGAGVGYYHDQAAVGASLRHTSDSGRWSFTAGISGGAYGGVAARVGISGVLN